MSQLTIFRGTFHFFFFFFWGGGVTIIIFYNYIYSNVPGVGGTNFSYLYFSTRQFC